MKGGKKNTEKKMRRQEKEIKVKQSHAGDASLGVMDILVKRTRADGNAHVVLSVGNRVGPVASGAASIELVKSVEEVGERRVGRRDVEATTIAEVGDRKKLSFGFAGKK
jgi:hypothetical protein